jgi:ribosome-binding protein aMBF1 (putative translation factor)
LYGHRNRARHDFTTSKRLVPGYRPCCRFSARWPRAALGLGARELAAKASVSPDTVFRLEKGEALHQRSGIAIREALEDAGVVFIDENGGGAGVRLRKAMLK